jgi:hypothetical protein
MAFPTEDESIEALKRVQSLTPEEFQRAMHDDIGPAMLQVFNALARALHPMDSDDEIAKKLHLMMLAWLMSRELPSPRA